MTDIKPVLETIYIPPTAEVSVRPDLVSEWTPLVGVFVDSFTAASTPNFGSARLSYRAGVGMQLGGPQQIGVWTSYYLDQWQVRLRFFDGTDPNQQTLLPATWYGIIVSDDRQLMGTSVAGNGTRYENTWQTFAALDMGYLLDKVPVNRSIVSGQAAPVGRAIAFNGGRGAGRDTNLIVGGNRSQGIETNGAHVFADDLANATGWTNANIARYLAHNFQPVVRGQAVPITFTGDSIEIDWERPLVRAHGRTVKNIFDELFNPRRLVGWAAGWDDQSESIVIKVFSYNSEPTTLASGEVIPANGNQVTFDFDTAFDVASANLRRLSHLRSSQVVVRGARRGAVFTVSTADGTLEADWTAENQTAYNDGASGATSPSYSSLDFGERQKRNALVRGQNDLRRVYRYFRIPVAWDFKSNDGENGGTASPVVPAIDVQGAITPDSVPLWRPGLVLEQYLPLLSDIAYDSLPPTVNLPPGSIPHPLGVQVFIKTPTTANDSTDRWSTAADLGPVDGQDLVGGGQRWRIAAAVQRQNLGLVLEVMGGQQHLIADNEFTVIGDEDTPAVLDWQTDMLATVYMESDDHVEVWYPAGADQSEAGVTALQISDDQYRLDYLAPGTVVGVADGELVRNTNGGYIRDDRQRMADHAKAAYEWYSRVRNALDVTVRTVLPIAQVGDLVTTIGSGSTQQTVNTPITAITVTLGSQGQGHPPETTFITDFGVTEFGQLHRGSGRQPRPPAPANIPAPRLANR